MVTVNVPQWPGGCTAITPGDRKVLLIMNMDGDDLQDIIRV